MPFLKNILLFATFARGSTVIKKIRRKDKEYTPMNKDVKKHVELSSNDLGFNLEELQGHGLEYFARERCKNPFTGSA